MQPPANRAAAVLYAKDIDRVGAFYAGVMGMRIAHTQVDHVLLESPALELAIVAIPKALADSITIDDPPVRREDTPIKLVFFVPDLAAARTAAARLGGELNGPAREWRFGEFIVCDGHDPEGNVVQLRTLAPGESGRSTRS